MTQKTAGDIASDALSKLGVAQAGQDISAEDMELALSKVQDVVDDLAARGVCYVPNLDSVDGPLGTHLAWLTAILMRPDFADDGSFLPDASAVEGQIRIIQARTTVREPQRAVYF